MPELCLHFCPFSPAEFLKTTIQGEGWHYIYISLSPSRRIPHNRTIQAKCCHYVYISHFFPAEFLKPDDSGKMPALRINFSLFPHRIPQNWTAKCRHYIYISVSSSCRIPQNRTTLAKCRHNVYISLSSSRRIPQNRTIPAKCRHYVYIPAPKDDSEFDSPTTLEVKLLAQRFPTQLQELIEKEEFY